VDWPATSELRIFTAADGAQLAGHVLGAGPPLLVIPGLGTDHHALVWNIRGLSELFECLVLDQRGIGRSEVTPGPYTIAQLADDAASVLRGWAPRTAAVMGLSMGGMVSQQLAIRHPQLVARLVLGCTGPGGASAVRADPEVTRRLLGGGANDPASAYRTACTVLYERGWSAAHPEVIEDAVSWRAQHPVRPGVFRAHWEATRHHDSFALLDKIEAPTTILHGRSDLVMPPGNAEVLAARISGAELVWFEGRGHMFFQEDPGLTLSLLQSRLLAQGSREGAPKFPRGAVPDTIAARKGED